MLKRKFLPYDPKLKQLVKNLRNKSTKAEVLLWTELKNGKMRGLDFHRQKPVGNYIIDFFCPMQMLAIEIDGATHGDKEVYDAKRQVELEKMGIKFLRYDDFDIKDYLEKVVASIGEWIDDNMKKNKNTVLAFGTFDGLHPGHEFFLQEAKKLGSVLRVVISRDANVLRLKKKRPKFDEQARKAALEQSGLADEVILGKEDMSYDIVKEVGPDLIALGYDQAVDMEKLKQVYDGPVVRLKAFKPEKYKSSKLN